MTIAEVLEKQVPADVLRLFRPPRADVLLPIVEAISPGIPGACVIEIGSGDTLLLAKALRDRGSSVVAIDPALAGIAEPGIECRSDDVFALDPATIAPADVTISSLFFGAPLRQRARRDLWPRYRSGEKPSELEVFARLQEVERTFVQFLGAVTKPGGVTVHFSLEGLFAVPREVWESAGFQLVSWWGNPHDGSSANVLRRLVVASRAHH